MIKLLKLLLLCGLSTACNRAPEIETVGNVSIADSIADLVDPSMADEPSFLVEQGQFIELPFVAVDPDQDPLRWSAGPLPIGSMFDSEAGIFFFEPLNSRLYPSRMDLNVVVEDPEGAWDSVVISLVVVPSPTPEL